MLRSTPYRFAKTWLRCPKRHCISLRVPPSAWCVLNQPESSHSITLAYFEEFVFSTFPVEDDLKEEPNFRFCCPIFNETAEPMEKLNKGQRIVRYISANRLLKSSMEKGESEVKVCMEENLFGCVATNSRYYNRLAHHRERKHLATRNW